jgi:hypothetical protein
MMSTSQGDTQGHSTECHAGVTHITNIILEAKVDHAIGFIKAQVGADVQIKTLLVQQVFQPPRRRYDNVHATLDQVHLWPQVDTACRPGARSLKPGHQQRNMLPQSQYSNSGGI